MPLAATPSELMNAFLASAVCSACVGCGRVDEDGPVLGATLALTLPEDRCDVADMLDDGKV